MFYNIHRVYHYLFHEISYDIYTICMVHLAAADLEVTLFVMIKS